MRFHNLMSEYVFLPIGKTCSGRKYVKAKGYQHFLEKTQYWDRTALEDLRNRYFRELVSHCYMNVPFYRQYMDANHLNVQDFRTVSDITNFPLLTNEMVNNHQDSLTAANYGKSKINYQSTGGSMGIPTRFGRDKPNEYRVDANNRRFWKYGGYIPGMTTALFWGNQLELGRSTSLRERAKRLMENTKILNCFELSEDSLKEYTEYMQRRRPDVIRGYSTAIYIYTQYCKEHGIRFTESPKSIILTSDKIYEPQKREISDFFGCGVFEEYGSREFSILAHECAAHEGLHLAEELFVFEVLDLSSGTCSFGGQGEMVVTPLFNYAMPLLRYRLGDEVHITSERCACGRSLKKVSDIQGRINDFTVTKSGRFIYNAFFATLFYSCKGISRYQVRQSEKGRIVVHLVKKKHFSETELDGILAQMREEWGEDLEVSFQFVDDIEVPPSGKRRIVISSIASQYITGAWRPIEDVE